MPCFPAAHACSHPVPVLRYNPVFRPGHIYDSGTLFRGDLVLCRCRRLPSHVPALSPPFGFCPFSPLNAAGPGCRTERDQLSFCIASVVFFSRSCCCTLSPSIWYRCHSDSPVRPFSLTPLLSLLELRPSVSFCHCAIAM